ncbi:MULTISPECIES: MFS transporter [Tsukamurella]|uniref:MFS transporter n=2 Tax=Tsukamurella TaxID=2060 RepID=A0A5C5RVW3_9ACTN|nr:MULTISPECIES: MFS transporter [Tsukamurella]NMD56263.1 MFS transporter [Tsukamurella columbiensis]TWS27186.1 MFS transporter [Tsukamurella conjunctivitidis]
MTETGTVASPATGPNRRTQILTGSVGHLVEYFDWSAYSFLAIYFSRQFFPGDAESVVPLLATFTVFAVGFLARPVGGIVMGRMADRYGRRPTLAVGVAMMGLGSLVIGVAPTYAQVGVLAPIILVVARLIQGLSTGGELSTATAFLVESAPAGRRGAYGSIVNVGSSLGKVLCLFAITLLVGAVGADAMADWAWRVPFLAGAVLAVVAWWIRRSASETLSDAGTPTGASPYREILTGHRADVARAFVLASTTAAVFYAWSTFVPTWAILTQGLNKESAVIISAIAFAVYGLVQIPLGLLSDRIGRKPMMCAFLVAGAVATVPLFLALSDGFGTVLAVQCVGMGITALMMASLGTALAEMFPARIRVLATGTSFALATAIFGGTIPAIGTALHGRGLDLAFPIYLVVLHLVALPVALRCRETAHAPLPD